MRACLTEEELFALVDGAASDKDAAVWRKHVAGCERCTRSVEALEKALATLGEDEPIDVKEHADAVMASLDRAPAKRQRVLMPLAVSGIALAAALLLGIGIGRGTRPDDAGEFTARGGGSASALERDIAIDVLKAQADGTFIRMEEHEAVATTASFAARYRNVGATNSCALVFLVDAKRDVHWLYPAFIDPRSNPSSIAIPPATAPHSMGDGVTFSDLAPGAAIVVTMLTKTPLSVSQIEQQSDVTPDALRRAFPDAVIHVLPIRVQP
jgi:hypothetical protein